MNGVLAAGYFLFSLVFSLVTFVLIVRMVLRYLRVSALHPIGQVIHKLTDPVILPLTHILKFANTRKSRYDMPCFIVLVTVEIIKFVLIGFIFFTAMLPLGWLIIYPFADIIVQVLNMIFYAVLIRAIMSWINPTWRNPLADLLILITEPILSYVRRFVPYIAGFDFSPVIVLVVIKVLTLFVSASLPYHLI